MVISPIHLGVVEDENDDDKDDDDEEDDVAFDDNDGAFGDDVDDDVDEDDDDDDDFFIYRLGKEYAEKHRGMTRGASDGGSTPLRGRTFKDISLLVRRFINTH